MDFQQERPLLSTFGLAVWVRIQENHACSEMVDAPLGLVFKRL
jgi:hypothetical protein